MNSYEFEVILKVKADAFDKDDAREILYDTFGLGEDCGVNIEQAQFNELA